MQTNYVSLPRLAALSLLILCCFGVDLNDGRYKIIIRIDSSVADNLESKIITQLKIFFTHTSEFIRRATNDLTWFEEIVIITPNSWTTTANFQFWNEMRKADVIVRMDSNKHEPRTEQSEGCGYPGDSIVIPVEFLLETDSLEIAKRVLTKQWVQYRYGVFEEHGWENDLTYPTKYWTNGRLETTNCFHAYNCDNEQEKCYSQSTPSLMFNPRQSTAVQFCNNSTHNFRAPNRQNILCNYRSVYDVIYDHPDFKNRKFSTNCSVTTHSSTIPQIKIVRQSDIHVIIVIDASHQRENVHWQLEQALAFLILDQIPNGCFLSIIEHKDGNAYVVTNATKLTGPDIRESILDEISHHLTDEMDAYPASISSAIDIAKRLFLTLNDYQTIFLIPIVNDEDLKDQLKDIMGAEIYLFYVNLFEIQSMYDQQYIHYSILSDPNQLIISFKHAMNKFLETYHSQTEKTSTIINEFLNDKDVTFYVEPHVDQLVISIASSVVDSIREIVLVPPIGKPIVRSHSNHCTQLLARGINVCKITSPKAGIWRMSLYTDNLSQIIYLDVSVVCVSCVYLDSWLNYRDIDLISVPPKAFARIGSHFIGNVTGTINHPQTGWQRTINLVDDGRDPDILSNDGIYTSLLDNHLQPGWSCVTVQVKGSLNFQRISTAGCFYVRDPTRANGLLSIPTRILDLRLERITTNSDLIKLVWSTSQNVSTFDIRWSENGNNLQSSFDLAEKLLFDKDDLTSVNLVEKMLIVSTRDFNWSTCLAIKCVNDDGISGSVSNIACIGRAMNDSFPELNRPTSSNKPIEWVNSTKNSMTTKVFVIFSFATAFSLIALFLISVTICILLFRYKLVPKRGKLRLAEQKALNSKNNRELEDSSDV